MGKIWTRFKKGLSDDTQEELWEQLVFPVLIGMMVLLVVGAVVALN